MANKTKSAGVKETGKETSKGKGNRKMKKKWMWAVLIGGGLVVYYIMKKMSGTSTASTVSASLPLGYNTPTTTYGGAATGGTGSASAYAGQTATALSALEAQIQGLQNATTTVPTSSGSASNLGTGNNIPSQLQGRYNVGGAGMASYASAVAAAKASGSPLIDTRNNKTLTPTLSPTFYVEGKYNKPAQSNYAGATKTLTAAQGLANQTAKQQAGQGISILNNQGNQVGYAISLAGANGQLHTGSSYNADVNANKGQYIAHTWFAGHYAGNKFVTTNSKQQQKYNTLSHSGAGA